MFERRPEFLRVPAEPGLQVGDDAAHDDAGGLTLQQILHHSLRLGEHAALGGIHGRGDEHDTVHERWMPHRELGDHLRPHRVADGKHGTEHMVPERVREQVGSFGDAQRCIGFGRLTEPRQVDRDHFDVGFDLRDELVVDDVPHADTVHEQQPRRTRPPPVKDIDAVVAATVGGSLRIPKRRPIRQRIGTLRVLPPREPGELVHRSLGLRHGYDVSSCRCARRAGPRGPAGDAMLNRCSSVFSLSRSSSLQSVKRSW